MKLVQAYLAFDNILFFIDVLLTPMTEAGADNKARPIVAVILVMARVELQITINTMLSNKFRDRTFTT